MRCSLGEITQNNLINYCHVNSNDDGDSFVGVKIDTEGAMVYFPIGYQLSSDDDGLRAEINNLLGVLASFAKEDGFIDKSAWGNNETVTFPMHAYLKIICDFLRTNRYYTENDPYFKSDIKGRISWSRTVREQKALVQKNGSLIFTNLTIRFTSPNTNKKITQIHKYCVYEAFSKMGWLYVSYIPEKPSFYPDSQETIYLLTKKLATTHNDKEQELFSAMIAMLQYMDERSSDKSLSFGTYFFERIWEKMIDRAFGISDKKQYFPRTKWLLDYGTQKTQVPLQPDSIMIYNGKVYILDAKLYRYGCSGKPEHLPSGPDINKQITYGEYIETHKKISSEKLYNAFIMPFNFSCHPFMSIGADGQLFSHIINDIGNIGEAVGDWKPNLKYYERIQGIVIDTRFLLHNYMCMPEQQKNLLAKEIEKVRYRNSISLKEK